MPITPAGVPRIILDTDIGPDCDDCGALAILDRYHTAGKIKLLGVTHCTSDICGAYTVRAINRWFGVDVPIGQTERTGFLDGAEMQKYTLPIGKAERDNNGECEFAPAVPLLRRLLTENDGVTLVFIGPLNNLAELLESTADEISTLNGVELVKKSVDEIIIMGGNFKNPAQPEFNIQCDTHAAHITAEKSPVPLTFCGFEAGENVLTGASFDDCPDDYPVKQAYAYYTKGELRPSWDLITVYYALTPDSPDWQVSGEIKADFDGDGRTIIREGHGARYVSHRDEAKLQTELDKIIGLK